MVGVAPVLFRRPAVVIDIAREPQGIGVDQFALRALTYADATRVCPRGLTPMRFVEPHAENPGMARRPPATMLQDSISRNR